MLLNDSVQVDMPTFSQFLSPMATSTTTVCY